MNFRLSISVLCQGWLPKAFVVALLDNIQYKSNWYEELNRSVVQIPFIV